MNPSLPSGGATADMDARQLEAFGAARLVARRYLGLLSLMDVPESAVETMAESLYLGAVIEERQDARDDPRAICAAAEVVRRAVAVEFEAWVGNPAQDEACRAEFKADPSCFDPKAGVATPPPLGPVGMGKMLIRMEADRDELGPSGEWSTN